MKNLIKLCLLPLAVGFIAGCAVPLPEAPTLISPAADTTIEIAESEVEFNWSSVSDAVQYNFQLSIDTTADFDPPFQPEESGNLVEIFNDDFTDTACFVPIDTFENGGTYYWQVRSIDESGRTGDWSGLARFYYEEPETTILVGLDLDTTYFPFGLDFVWCYERKVYEHTFSNEGGDWDTTYYDTFSLAVLDSLCNSDGWNFPMSGGTFQDIQVCDENEILIVNKQYYVPVWWDTIRIALYEGSYSNDYGRILVSRSKDTAKVSIVYDDIFVDEYTHSATRVKGIGAIRQSYIETRGFPYTYDLSDRLLYFYNGTDTVYKAPDWEG